MAFESSSSASSSTSPPTKWDVFLSFRGIDTRYNFSSHMYSALDRYGIRIFMDDPELRTGEVISDALLKAIQESKTYIVVLSENYASSSWCLDELVEILNCNKTMPRLVIPVFYKIDPSIVRRQTGSFEQPFKKHEIRFAREMERVKTWRFTLRQVADKSGKHICENRSEADIINDIVNEILFDINPMALDVGKYQVGLESRVKGITALLGSGTKGVTKIGIYGMGGIGKTTLAKALFNQLLLESFKGSCFLANVREILGTVKGLESLQQQLINDVLKSKKRVKVNSVDQGTKLIRARICSATVLVVIDDLDDCKQFDSLVGPFASGSVVIVTTRDEEILDKIEVETKYRYKVSGLDDAESLRLFFQHAFGDTEPNNTLMVLSKDILNLAGGLPLALEVFGSYLYKRSEVEWNSYIDKLRRIPNSNIQQRLKISLDALELDDPMLKKMFLDIACFFIGRKIEKVVDIMESYYSYADNKIDILKKRCLLTINNRNELRMHDLLQDMGREIACNNSLDEPGKHSRLWVTEQICDVLEKHEGTGSIEVIKLEYEDPIKEVSFAIKAFRRMTKLRFLYIKGINLTGNFEQTLEDLRWFCWDGCPLKCLPFEFCPQKLVILELPYSRMKKIWEVSQVFKKLRTLNLSFSRYLTTTPDFTKLFCLKTLNLEGCESLEEVHKSIGSLESLVFLNLRGCVKLRSLPDSICNLRALKTLNIDVCGGLKALPEELGSIESLTEISACKLNVSKLPDSIGCLGKLDKLILDSNTKLETLPGPICNLRALKFLSVGYCTSLDALPEELGNIDSLTEINASNLNVLKLPYSIGCLSKLVKLKLDCNKKLDTLPNTICNLRALEFLSINHCTNLEALPVELGNIESLRELSAWGLTVSKLPDSTGSLSKLVELVLNYNEELEILPDTICNLRSLEILKMNHCKKLVRLPDQLWKLTRLRELGAFGAILLKKLPDIGSSENASSLEIFDLSYSGVTALPSGFSQLSNLTTLLIRNCDHLFSIPKLPRNLKRIDAFYCKSLERLPNLSNLKHLETADLRYCSGLTEIHGLEELTSLTELNLACCNSSLPTKRTFQTFLGHGHQIGISMKSREFLYWMSESNENGLTTAWGCCQSTEYKYESKLCFDLPPNVSQNYLGMILCFKCPENQCRFYLEYTVKTSTGGLFKGTNLLPYQSCRVIILPRSIFSVTGGDARIEITTTGGAEVLETHLLLKLEVTMTDEDSSTIVDELKLVDPKLQDIFLDIACFFIGWKNEEVVKILETCYTSVNHYIDILKERCLISINYKYELEMHDRFRDIGRKVAHNNSPPGTRSRLWLSIDIYDVLKNHTGTIAIEGIVRRKLDYQDALEGKSFTRETFKRMSKLRFLYFKNVYLIGSFEKTLEDLRWLCWDECPLECLPSEFYPQKLVILELPHSRLRTMWETNMVVHVLDKLKTLNMSYSLALTTTPDFTKLPCLETLNFEYCESLEEVHVSIGSLVRLFSLNLHNCGKLTTLPHTICNLRALRCLDISGCSSLDALPIELGNIESLRNLIAKGLNIWKIPNSIGRLSKLVELRLGCNKNLETLPNTICNLSSLIILDISGCERLEILPDQLWKLTRLRELDVSGTTLLINLPDIESSQIALSLEKLNLSESSVTSLPSGISQLSALERLSNLKCIYAYGCTSIERLTNLSDLKQLEVLDLTNCSCLTEIIGLEELTCITVLHWEGCTSSLLASTLTKRLFQIYFGFGHPIEIYASKLPDWLWQSENCRRWCPYNGRGSASVSFKVPPNGSHNLLGMILFFECIAVDKVYGIGYPFEKQEVDLNKEIDMNRIDYFIQNKTTHFLWSGFFCKGSEALMVIIPISIFPIGDGDKEIYLRSSDLNYRCGICLLYESEDDSTTANVEDDMSNSSVSDSKSIKNRLSLGGTTVKRWVKNKVTLLNG